MDRSKEWIIGGVTLNDNEDIFIGFTDYEKPDVIFIRKTYNRPDHGVRLITENFVLTMSQFVDFMQSLGMITLALASRIESDRLQLAEGSNEKEAVPL